MACGLSTIAITPQQGASRFELVENYFNYFTEIEEQFRKCRSEAVLVGIARAFEKFKAGKRSYRKVNSLAYCSQEVFRAVEEARATAVQGGTPRPAKAEAPAPFSAEEIARFL